jgi:hypothetical protein
MSNLMETFFGPLDKNACLYFFIVTVLFFISFILLLLNELVFVVQNFRKMNMRMLVNGILILFNIFLAYFVNRLMYSMCTKSLA